MLRGRAYVYGARDAIYDACAPSAGVNVGAARIARYNTRPSSPRGGSTGGQARCKLLSA